jgi:hypothetical protein
MWHRWREYLERIEAVLGLLATFIIGFALPVVALVTLVAGLVNWGWPWVPPSVLVLLLATLPAVGLARLANAALHDRFPELVRHELKPAGAEPMWFPFGDNPEIVPAQLPLALVMAARLPPFPFLPRPFLGFWWLAHFAAGIVLGVGLHAAAHQALAGAPIARILVPQVLHFGVLFAVNLYLLLAVAVVLRRPALWIRVWRCRVLIDLAVMGASLWIGGAA